MPKPVKKLPSIEELRAKFNYNPNTGIITRRHNTQGHYAGIAGRQCNGYIVIGYNGINYGAHRIAYALHHGVDPYPNEVDHINRDKKDNRICNLRIVTKSEQQSNRTFAKSGHWAITFTKNAWQIVIKRKYYGRCKTLEEAIHLRNSICEREGIAVIM